MKQKNIKLNFINFLTQIFLKDYKSLIVLIILSITSSYLIFKIQNISIEITKSLRPMSVISGTAVILDKIDLKPKSILSEYVGFIKLGIDKNDLNEIKDDFKKDLLNFEEFENFRKKIKADNLRDFRGEPLYQIHYEKKIEIALKDKFFKKFPKNFYFEFAVKENDKIISNLKLIDEMLKFKILKFMNEKTELIKINDSNTTIYKFDDKKFSVSNDQSSQFKFDKVHYDYINTNHGINANSFVNGINNFNYKVKKFKFSEIFSMTFLIILIIFSMIKIIKLD